MHDAVAQRIREHYAKPNRNDHIAAVTALPGIGFEEAVAVMRTLRDRYREHGLSVRMMTPEVSEGVKEACLCVQSRPELTAAAAFAAFRGIIDREIDAFGGGLVRVVCESSLSRILCRLAGKDAALMTAFLPVGRYDDNEKETQRLRTKLITNGCRVTRVFGRYAGPDGPGGPDGEENEQAVCLLAEDLSERGTDGFRVFLAGAAAAFGPGLVFLRGRDGSSELFTASCAGDGYESAVTASEAVESSVFTGGIFGNGLAEGFFPAVMGQPFVFESIGKSKRLTDYGISTILAVKKLGLILQD